MPVITFATFVVVADDSFSGSPVVETVPEAMAAADHRRGHLPDHHLNDRPIVEVQSLTMQQQCRHVGHYANEVLLLSMTPTLW